YVPISPTEVYWYSTLTEPADTSLPSDVLGMLAERHRGWTEPVADLIHTTDPDALFRTPITDRPALPSWGKGRITLLGDAAHPMTPNLGQGACQAIEDAVALADSLDEYPDLPHALRAYEMRRAPRVDGIVRMARDLGRRGHTPHGWQKALQASDNPLDENDLRWLYSGTVRKTDLPRFS
ncbi:hypothetical protein GTY86_00655, partial [Streptomyces sp. SID5770]|uniref:FAD-dependent monooxygenase n=1 Tax=Streptomyces sp. SID5770 TaxID=2690308 RepID=UPI00138375C9